MSPSVPSPRRRAWRRFVRRLFHSFRSMGRIALVLGSGMFPGMPPPPPPPPPAIEEQASGGKKLAEL